MKKIIASLLLLLIVPQVVLAAWWNPISWFNNWSFIRGENSETEILNDELRESESELASTTNSAVTSVLMPPTAAVNKNQVEVLPSSTVQTPKSSQAEIEDIKQVFARVLFDSITLDNEMVQILEKVAKDSSSTYDQKYDLLYELNSVQARNHALNQEVQSYIDQIDSLGYVDDNYWRNTGIPKLAIRQKQLREEALSAINDYLEERGGSTTTYQPVYFPTTASSPTYDDTCDVKEEELRSSISSSGGTATESQIQALLNNLGCY